MESSFTVDVTGFSYVTEFRERRIIPKCFHWKFTEFWLGLPNDSRWSAEFKSAGSQRIFTQLLRLFSAFYRVFFSSLMEINVENESRYWVSLIGFPCLTYRVLPSFSVGEIQFFFSLFVDRMKKTFTEFLNGWRMEVKLGKTRYN